MCAVRLCPPKNFSAGSPSNGRMNKSLSLSRRRTVRWSAASLLTCLAVVGATTEMSATWSIVAVDPVTREVGSAGASCTGFVAGIADVAPGHGAIVAQAASNTSAKRRGREMLSGGAAPSDVLNAITSPDFDPDWQSQQYGIAALMPAPIAQAFTGLQTPDWRGSRQGPGVSVQGNILTGPEVVDAAFAAFIAPERAKASLAERLLAALEAGGRAGGDRRCGAQTALSSYLLVAAPNDTAENPSVGIIISGQARGGPNPVTLLRQKFDETHTARADSVRPVR